MKREASGLRLCRDSRVGGWSKPYTLVAMAPSVAELVAMAGGLLCDRALTGWAVTTVADGDASDAAALRTLGVSICCAPADLAVSIERVQPQTLVVPTELLTRDGFENTLAAFDLCGTELLFYGRETSTARLPCVAIEYQMSSAALAFKGHALTAAGVSLCRPGSVESFLRSAAPPLFGTTALQGRHFESPRVVEQQSFPVV
jgi:hypothetical protein